MAGKSTRVAYNVDVPMERSALLGLVLTAYREEAKMGYKDFLVVVSSVESEAAWNAARDLRDDLLEKAFLPFIGTASVAAGKYLIDVRVAW